MASCMVPQAFHKSKYAIKNFLQRTFASTSAGEYNYIDSRRAYRADVAELRKVFIAEVARKKEQLARDAEVQRQKIMKAKAARLEIKRQQQVIRAAEVANEKAIHEENARKYFEEKTLVRQARQEEMERRRQAIIETLAQQSEKWINQENIKEKIKEDIFIYSPQQISFRRTFDPNSGGSALSWLEKLQQMKPATKDSSKTTNKE